VPDRWSRRADHALAMRRLAAALVLCASTACQHGTPSRTSAEEPRPDTELVLPGGFSEQTTVADLEARFGASNVTIADVPDGLGATRRGVVLFADDPTRRAYVRFYEEEPLRHLASVTVTDAGSLWRGKLGVRIGTSFAELGERNGAAFWFRGFDTGRQGMVRDGWDAGALDVSEGEALYFGVDLRLRGEVAPDAAVPHGDDAISSDDPRYPMLGGLAEVSAITAWSSLDDEW